MAACGTIIGIEEHHASDPDGSAIDASPAEAASPDRDGNTSAPDGGALEAQTLGQFVDPMLAMGDGELLVHDQSGPRSTIVVISKNDPSNPKTIYDQPSASPSTRVSPMGVPSPTSLPTGSVPHGSVATCSHAVIAACAAASAWRLSHSSFACGMNGRVVRFGSPESFVR